jgi:tetratricopeptide (TPR) repeat protein
MILLQGFLKRAIEEYKKGIDLNENFEEAISLAKKGLELDPKAESAPLGHYVLADIYSQLELWEEYNSEVKKGPALEQELKKAKM